MKYFSRFTSLRVNPLFAAKCRAKVDLPTCLAPRRIRGFRRFLPSQFRIYSSEIRSMDITYPLSSHCMAIIWVYFNLPGEYVTPLPMGMVLTRRAIILYTFLLSLHSNRLPFDRFTKDNSTTDERRWARMTNRSVRFVMSTVQHLSSMGEYPDCIGGQ